MRGSVIPLRHLAVAAGLGLALLVLPGCERPEEAAKQALRGELVKAFGVEYRNVSVLHGDVVCGEYRQESEWGDWSDYRRFIYRDGRADARPGKLDWSVYCADDPGQGLFDATGIGPYGSDNRNLQQVHADLTLLRQSVDEFMRRKGYLPPDLDQLTAATDEDPAILAALPRDPWGEPYLFDGSLLGFGTRSAYRLFTLGADKQPGGRGENADVGSEQLERLDFIRDQF